MTRIPMGRVALASLLAVTLAGCAAARNSLGTTASPCFDALAIAGNAVHHRGTFAGVVQVSLDKFNADAHRPPGFSMADRGVRDVCVVAYQGQFRPDQVERPFGPTPAGGVGRYAIVVVSKPQNRLLGTVVRQTEPLRFRDLL